MKKKNVFGAIALMVLALSVLIGFTACPSASTGGAGTTEYAVNFSVDGTNGTLEAKVDGKAVNSGDKIEQDKTITFTATPLSGYKVDNWTITGGSFEEGTGTSGSTTAKVKITADTNIAVSFKLPTYTVTFETRNIDESSPSTNGTLTVTVDGQPITSPAQVQENKEVVFTAVPNTGAFIAKWYYSAGGIFNYINGTNPTYTKTITENCDVNVYFTKIPQYFQVGDLRYKVTDDVNNFVSVTAENSDTSGDYTEYTEESLHIPKTVTYTDGSITVNCTVTGIHRPDLWGNTVKAVTVEAGHGYLAAQDGVVFNNDKTALLWYPLGKDDLNEYTVPATVKTLKENSFYKIPNTSPLTKVILPNGLKTIEGYVLVRCPNITELNLPDSLEVIYGESINSLGVSTMKIPEGITEFYAYLLAWCPNLTKVDLPSSIVKFGRGAFMYNPNFTELICRAQTPPDITGISQLFQNTPIGNITLKVPAGSVNDYKTADGWKDLQFLAVEALP